MNKRGYSSINRWVGLVDKSKIVNSIKKNQYIQEENIFTIFYKVIRQSPKSKIQDC